MGFNLWHSTKFLLNSCRWPGHRLLHIADPSTQSCLMVKLCWNRACSSGNADDQTTGWTAAPRASHTLCEYQLSWLITLIMLTKALHQFYAKSKQHQMAKKKKKLVRFYCYFCATCLPIFTWMFMHWAKRHDHNWARTTSSFQVTESLQVDTDWFGFPGGFQFLFIYLFLLEPKKPALLSFYASFCSALLRPSMGRASPFLPGRRSEVLVPGCNVTPPRFTE